jgi:hypothetical protein
LAIELFMGFELCCADLGIAEFVPSRDLYF